MPANNHDNNTDTNPNNTTSTPSGGSGSNGGAPVGAIVGGVIGGLAVIGIVVLGVVFMLLRYRRQKASRLNRGAVYSPTSPVVKTEERGRGPVIKAEEYGARMTRPLPSQYPTPSDEQYAALLFPEVENLADSDRFGDERIGELGVDRRGELDVDRRGDLAHHEQRSEVGEDRRAELPN